MYGLRSFSLSLIHQTFIDSIIPPLSGKSTPRHIIFWSENIYGQSGEAFASVQDIGSQEHLICGHYAPICQEIFCPRV